MEAPVYARRLTICRAVDYNPFDPEAPYTLRGVVNYIRPEDDYGYPLCVETLWIYAELYGEPGRYYARALLTRVDDDGEDVGRPVTLFDQRPAVARLGAFVSGVRFRLSHVVFGTPGVYEFRLLLDGFDEPLASERVLLREG